ncbi:MAG: hypothetical protein J5748_05490 [Bacteroidales bacterium]|nr:hypothetical protein [Bacteroidales bacterium]
MRTWRSSTCGRDLPHVAHVRDLPYITYFRDISHFAHGRDLPHVANGHKFLRVKLASRSNSAWRITP